MLRSPAGGAQVTEIILPPIPDRGPALWLGVIIEPSEIAGTPAWSVTVRDGYRTARRRWFPDRTLALLHAADMADAAGIPLFDRTLTAGGAE